MCFEALHSKSSISRRTAVLSKLSKDKQEKIRKKQTGSSLLLYLLTCLLALNHDVKDNVTHVTLHRSLIRFCHLLIRLFFGIFLFFSSLLVISFLWLPKQNMEKANCLASWTTNNIPHKTFGLSWRCLRDAQLPGRFYETLLKLALCAYWAWRSSNCFQWT